MNGTSSREVASSSARQFSRLPSVSSHLNTSLSSNWPISSQARSATSNSLSRVLPAGSGPSPTARRLAIMPSLSNITRSSCSVSMSISVRFCVTSEARQASSCCLSLFSSTSILPLCASAVPLSSRRTVANVVQKHALIVVRPVFWREVLPWRKGYRVLHTGTYHDTFLAQG